MKLKFRKTIYNIIERYHFFNSLFVYNNINFDIEKQIDSVGFYLKDFVFEWYEE